MPRHPSPARAHPAGSLTESALRVALRRSFRHEQHSRRRLRPDSLLVRVVESIRFRSIRPFHFDDEAVVSHQPDPASKMGENLDPHDTTAGDARAGDTAASAPAPARPRRELVAWRNAIFTIFFLSGLSLASWVARIPAVRDDVGLSTQGVGLIILTGSIGSIVGLIAAPGIMARFGARLGMSGMLVTVAIGLVFVGIGGSILPSVPLVVTGLVLFGF